MMFVFQIWFEHGQNHFALRFVRLVKIVLCNPIAIMSTCMYLCLNTYRKYVHLYVLVSTFPQQLCPIVCIFVYISISIISTCMYLCLHTYSNYVQLYVFVSTYLQQLCPIVCICVYKPIEIMSTCMYLCLHTYFKYVHLYVFVSTCNTNITRVTHLKLNLEDSSYNLPIKLL